MRRAPFLSAARSRIAKVRWGFADASLILLEVNMIPLLGSLLVVDLLDGVGAARVGAPVVLACLLDGAKGCLADGSVRVVWQRRVLPSEPLRRAQRPTMRLAS